ncbi:hypothetical protein Baya_8073 [Bagarius yarrelli]|uniref:Uncharacterized protein n=1 Tax=Bagarius yarrelli TaxID=175774 RepID=A0A556U471_BAGYA|nr:hypothetical protein Baya_8073 [Bagarius yarrelli]
MWVKRMHANRCVTQPPVCEAFSAISSTRPGSDLAEVEDEASAWSSADGQLCLPRSPSAHLNLTGWLQLISHVDEEE